MPASVRDYNSPAFSKNVATVTGFFVQDAWSMNRLTLNLGGRYDKYVGTLPGPVDARAARFVGPHTVPGEGSASTRTSLCGASARRTT